MSRLISLPPDVAALLTRLQQAGYAAYAVGGCVRDSLRGAAPADWDVATAASPQAVRALFGASYALPTGLKHGTVTVLTGERGVEVTTFRVEGGYSDGRRPDTVRFVDDITEDLRRRDFTVNAMAYNESEGLLDPFGGQEDLSRGCLRCVGDPRARFEEDALRILRGLRFAAVLNLTPHPDTARALHEERERLRAVAAERTAAELTRLLCGGNVLPVLRDFRDVAAAVLPVLVPLFDFDQCNPHHQYDAYLHTLHTVDAAPPDPLVRWAALLHDCGKPDCFTRDENGVGHFYGHPARSALRARETLTALKLDGATVETVTQLVEYHDRPIAPAPAAVRRMLNRLGETQLRRLLALKRADSAAHVSTPDSRFAGLDEVEAVLEEVLRQRDCFSLRDLAVKGDDLLAVGFSEGSVIGRILRYLLNAVIEGRLANEREVLLREVGEVFGTEGEIFGQEVSP